MFKARKEEKSSASSVFAYKGFTLLQTARFLTILALEMQSIAISWQIYAITRRPLDLGLVGLLQFLPAFALFLPAGQAADRFRRGRVLSCCYAGYFACSALLVAMTVRGAPSIPLIYLTLLLIGVVRAFENPTGKAFTPQLVPREHFPSAVAWQASLIQAANITGPAIGGVIYASMKGPAAVYGISMAFCAAAAVALTRVKPLLEGGTQTAVSLKSVLAGLRYTWQQKVILGATTLDLFAVLLGGATALLPVYAVEVFHTGPMGLGILRSAPGMGAVLTAVVVAHWRARRAGLAMLWCVAGYGIFTIIFGLSRSLAFSLVALFLLGATDMVSMIVRHTLLQTNTPDEMRGRVTAVNSLFVGASNQFGQFESGITAQWFGTIPAVVLGGAATLIVVAFWSWLFPEIRRYEEIRSAAARSNAR